MQGSPEYGLIFILIKGVLLFSLTSISTFLLIFFVNSTVQWKFEESTQTISLDIYLFSLPISQNLTNLPKTSLVSASEIDISYFHVVIDVWEWDRLYFHSELVASSRILCQIGINRYTDEMADS